jgi:hypothetical protein
MKLFFLHCHDGTAAPCVGLNRREKVFEIEFNLCTPSNHDIHSLEYHFWFEAFSLHFVKNKKVMV